MVDKKISKIKKELKELAKDFNLKYNSNWFKFMWTTKREGKYLEYVGMCWDPVYTPFGKTIKKRIRDIDKFDKSQTLKKISKRFGGQMITKKEVLEGLKNCKKIKNKELQEELVKLHIKIKSHLNFGHLALLTKTNVKKEKEFLFRFVLRHEWIHELLFRNGIDFSKINYEKYWKYNEGLATYLDYYISGGLHRLEAIKKKTKYPPTKTYYIYAIKFKNMLEGVKSPRGCKKIILNIFRKLKKNEK